MDTRGPSLVPEQFGPLQSVWILSTGTIVAQPFAGLLAAAIGAEVIRATSNLPVVSSSPRPSVGEWRDEGVSRIEH